MQCHYTPSELVQVYLGKWQETDVAVKVLTEIQNLTTHEGVHPQDPLDMGIWKGEDPPPRQGGNKATKVGGLRVIEDGGADSHGWGSDDDDSGIGVDSGFGVDCEMVPSEERQEALRTLEREVCKPFVSFPVCIPILCTWKDQTCRNHFVTIPR